MRVAEQSVSPSVRRLLLCNDVGKNTAKRTNEMYFFHPLNLACFYYMRKFCHSWGLKAAKNTTEKLLMSTQEIIFECSLIAWSICYCSCMYCGNKVICTAARFVKNCMAFAHVLSIFNDNFAKIPLLKILCPQLFDWSQCKLIHFSIFWTWWHMFIKLYNWCINQTN